MGGYDNDLLTTKEAARLLGVGTTSVKRWADAGVLECVRTPGRHRRFSRRAVEAMLDRPGVNDVEQGERPDDVSGTWLDTLLRDGHPRQLQSLLAEEHRRLGSWWRVADSLAPVLEEIGARWQRGDLSILEEHLASERLLRGVAACGDSISVDVGAPRALLLVADGEQHTLGLALAELCLREAGWATRWAGMRTPTDVVREHLRASDTRLVAVSASASFSDSRALREQAVALAEACREAAVGLIFGGKAEWPDPPPYGRRVHSFEQLNQALGDRV